MKPEIEAKFIVSSHDDIQQKLSSIGAELKTPKRLMRRLHFGNAQGVEENYLRLRDETDKVTLTHKKFDEIKSVDGTQELEIEVDSFSKAKELLQEIGFTIINETESRRETWVLDRCKVELDEWPWLPGYVEIEGPDEAAVRASAEKLGLVWDEAIFGSVREVYLYYYPNLPKEGRMLDSIKFNDDRPKILQ